MKPLGKYREEFIAKFLADLAKGIFVVGLASYFFRDFPDWLKGAMGSLFFLFAFLSIVVHPRKRGD